MVAYRTAESATTGYIYVYDSESSGDESLRIKVDLKTGSWLYEPFNWSRTSGLRYAPASLNFPAELWLTYEYDVMNTLAPAETHTGTMVGIDGTASLLITDDQGRQMGYKGDTLIHDIPGAAPLYTLGYNPEQPDADTPLVRLLGGYKVAQLAHQVLQQASARLLARRSDTGPAAGP